MKNEIRNVILRGGLILTKCSRFKPPIYVKIVWDYWLTKKKKGNNMLSHLLYYFHFFVFIFYVLNMNIFFPSFKMVFFKHQL